MTNLEIKQVEEFSEADKKAYDAAWEEFDIENYGDEMTPEDWESKKILLVAYVDSKFAGGGEFSHFAKVGHISKLMVPKEFRGSGVGAALLTEIENISKSLEIHKITLTTRQDWRAYQVYLDAGYEHTFTLKKHFFGVDHVYMTKFLTK